MNDLTDRATIIGVEYRVLGPLSASVRGDPRKLGGRRQQMVLAVLLSNPNEVTSQDKLIESVWAGHEPESARQTLHSYVSNLRKELGGGIDREGTGYVVHIDNDGLDSTRFEALVGRARGALANSPASALGFATEALALWHGPAFGDLGGEPALTTEAMRLEELRLSTIEIRVEADIAVGNHPAVIQELEALTTEHPFRERLWGFLILSLYRAGRQADALRSYRELRGILGEELGIEPSAELQALEEQILTQDPALDFTASGSSSVDRAARGYELREKIRETKFGALFRAFQGSVGREVAVLKVDEAITANPNFVRRFESEMRAASELEHPHLVPIYDFWRDPEGAYLVTALPRGGVLREVLADEPWNLSSVVRIVDQISSALSYLHRNGFVHGSLGSESILLDDESNSYLSNVGLSALVPSSDRVPSPADDVEALAALAMSLVTGSEAVRGTRISQLRPDLVELDSLFSRALHDDPASRFQKPEELRRALRQATGADVVPSGQELPTGSRRNPYKGLRAFKESDADDFHGRDALVEELIEALASTRLIAVVGPSGSGKSSLVRAGLLPALRGGAIEGSTRWLVAEMFPGTHPFEELEAALIRVATERPSGLFDELTSDRRGLARAAKMIIGNDEDQLVIVIDQFEELFSIVTSETNRRLFLESLTAVATDERSRIRVVLTLRADFFDQPLQYPEFAEAMSAGLVPISPPTEEGLTRAIAQPARGVGVDLQPGLVTRIIDDVRDEPGGLPLMQYALTELFNQRVNNTMTLAAYELSGGVAGALANRADEIYGDLSDEGRIAARNLFLRLVNVDELADDTRRRVRQTELKGLGINQAILDDVVQQFGAFRLLSFDRDAATRTPTVEVAHEALIREWARLRTWIDERREDLLIHRRIQITARDWEESGKDQSYLLRGSRLEQALIWQERTDLAISDDEMTFIEGSIEQERRDQAEHQALEEKAARRRKAVISSLAGGLVVAGVLGVIALDRAQEARVEAARATSQELSAAALLAVEEDPELAVLLALEGFEATEELGLDPTSEAVSALRTTRRELRVALRIPGGFLAISYSRTGELIALDGDEYDTRTFMVDASTGESLGSLEDPASTGGRPSFIGFSPDDESVAVARDYFYSGFIDGLDNDVDPAELKVAGVDLYDPNTHSHQVSLLGPPGFYTDASFGQGDLIASSWWLNSANSGALVWDRHSGGIVFDLAPASSGEEILSAEFLPGTTSLLIAYGLPGPGGGSDHGRIDLVDLNEDTVLWSFEVDIVPERVSISPNGTMVALTDFPARLAQILELPTGDIVRRIGHPSPQALAWSPDSTALSVSGNESDVTIYSVDNDSDPVVLTGHGGAVWDASFSPDGTRIASASNDGTARVWDITPAGLGGEGAYSIGGTPFGFSIDLEGEYLFASRLGGGAVLIDIESGSIAQTYPLKVSFPIFPGANAPITRIFGTQSDTGNGVILDADSGEILHEWECLTPRVVSPGGALAVLDGRLACDPGGGATFSRVVDLESGQVLRDLGEREIINAMFSPLNTDDSSGFLVINAGFQEIELYSLPELEKVGKMTAAEYGDAFLQVHLDPESKYLGIGAVGGVVGVVDLQAVSNGESMFEALALHVEGHKTNVTQVTPTSSGLAVSAGFDGFYRVWDIDSGERLFEIRVPGLSDPPSAYWTNDGQTLGYEDASGFIRLTSVDVDEVIAQARAALTRSLTDDECRQYLHTDGCGFETPS